ncbi:excinuclease ABC subunit C [Candidatus Woesearchaeota archaeon]|nr:excinuclease ABC subunit C [Candidatus Woesearchaeota archaeon]MBT6040961.1 excinuclease ABC subunit C [Candidatus Woesearchaeota archaeon]MBT6336149.1 excinuclease ABC subunit C [Candidatus Woesearchaeota archaeon]MBT7928094.1 excinuclease ABC subunit C [Candidatus Woesearchaeota archaeon]
MIDITKVPTNPGCYLFLDSKRNIIYIGKAKNLKKRVNSYFQKKHEDKKTIMLVSQIKNIEFIVTDNETEALILENNLIKKHEPKYNIDLKDSKRYAYIEITDENFPRLILARKRNNKGDYYGPFVSAAKRDIIMDLLIKKFKLRTCIKLPKKECLRYHIGLCDAPCTKKISKYEYNENIKAVKMVFSGKINDTLVLLKDKMKKYADKNEYERAIDIRTQIESIKWLKEKQKMERQRKYNEDIINFVKKGSKMYLILFNVYKGILENKQSFVFNYDDNCFEEFLLQYYSDKEVPKEIILPKEVSSPLQTVLSKKKKITFTIPKRGEKKLLLNLVRKNIEILFFKEEDALIELKKELRLTEIPNVIECFDVSHLSGTNTVASMVQFRNGSANKSNYRRYKIRTVESVDDFASISEVVRRRYLRLINENAKMPDLIVIDGGKGQLTSALTVLQELEVKVPIISLAKKLEEIFVPGLPVPLKINKKSKALKLLQQIRDEAHRFAITYHKLLRKKSIFKDDGKI